MKEGASVGMPMTSADESLRQVHAAGLEAVNAGGLDGVCALKADDADLSRGSASAAARWRRSWSWPGPPASAAEVRVE